ncbi:MAG: hypothetical protein GY720_04700 [bacterium]|nr:hypothetical protein [bacterium]
MMAPLQTEIVVVEGGAEYEIVVSLADSATSVGSFVQSVVGFAPPQVVVDGFPVANEAAVGDVFLNRGSRLEVIENPRSAPVCALVGLSGRTGAEVTFLAPGVHDFGSLDVGVQVPSMQGGAVCLYVDVDGTARLDPGANAVTVDGASIGSIARLRPGAEIHLDGQRYRFIGASQHVGQGRISFNRPPRSEFPAGLPVLVAPSAPPAAQKPMRFGWGALVIPVLMGGIMALVWSPMMAIFAVFSPAMMLANWYEDKRRARQSNQEADAEVAEAMIDFGNRFQALHAAAGTLAWRATPGPAQIIERVVGNDSRLWQRRHDHPDFMELGLGIGSLPWQPEIIPSETDRADMANDLIAAYPEIASVPVAANLANGRVVGITGHRRRQIEMARWLVAQAAVHHGPADMALAVITDHPEEWDWAKWLPHLQQHGDSTRLAVAAPGQESDDLLAALLETTDGDAAAGLRENQLGSTVLIVVDIEDVTAAAAATVRRALSGEGSARRCGIALGRTVEELPSSCSDIVRVDPAGLASLDRPSRAQRIGPFCAWRLAAPAARRIARHIGRFVDPELRGADSNLADVVHLLDLLGLSDRTSDSVVRRWDAAGPIPRCAAPIGATSEGNLVVDWVADGPHGLLAGTTGAGKSELLRSLVASLAASIDPEHLNFVLIDYKGGSAFDACAGLPHTVGMVTDLDGHLAHRALTCLEAELKYREEVLRSAAASDIDEYQALDRDEPLPRLLVVIDEFAALAKELPDFMAALVDVAQRGRSLGVHLLLATQRPNGVINDNIRANTNLRLSLRVQDVADSMDVVGTADAAALSRSRPGRGYLRRGPGDVVAFQSALVTGHSGGGGSALAVKPFALVAQPAASGVAGEATPSGSDLEVLVAMVSEAASKAGMRPARLPWPDPLPTQLSLDGLSELEPLQTGSDEIVIGMADEPHRQRRRPFTWDISSNLLLYGVQGSGTSTALISAITAACAAETVQDLHAYALDFDDQSLSILESLPHVGAVVGAGDRDRQVRLLRYLQAEVVERRELAASDLDSPATRPRIVVAVDNFAGFRAAFDDPADMAIKESLGRLVADGPGVGIVVLATAKQPIDIPTQVASLVPAKLVMQLADRYEYTGLGVSLSETPEVAGRAFESGTSLEVQLSLCGPADVASVAAATAPPQSGLGPWAIELLPTEVKIPDIVAGAEIFDLEWRVPVAIGDDRLTPVGWTMREGDHALISGPARSGKSTTLAAVAAVLRSARDDIRITALVPRRSILADCPDVDLLIGDVDQLEAALAACGEDQPHAILIDDAEAIEDANGQLAALVADRHPHRHVFAAGAGDVLRAAYGHWTQNVRRSRLGIALKPNISSDGDLWQTSLPRRGPAFFPAGRGYLVAEGQAELAQVAWQ